MNIQSWFPLGLTRLISMLSKGLSKSLLQHCSSKAPVFQHSAFFTVQLSQPYITTGKIVSLAIWTFVIKVMSLLFNMPSRFVIVFPPRSKNLLIWLQSLSTVILEPRKMKSDSFHFSPIYLPWSDGTWCHDLSFSNVEFKPTFSLSSFTFIKRSLVFLHCVPFTF